MEIKKRKAILWKFVQHKYEYTTYLQSLMNILQMSCNRERLENILVTVSLISIESVNLINQFTTLLAVSDTVMLRNRNDLRKEN